MTQRYRSSFSRSDGLLLALAAIGLIAFFVLLPAQHPYSAVDYGGQRHAVEAAAHFLAEAGFAAPEASPVKAHARIDGPTLDALQRSHGRAEAIRMLRSEEGRRLGVYQWRVSWADPDAPADELAVARLTADGQVMGLEVLRPSRFERAPSATDEDAGLPQADEGFGVAPERRLALLLGQTVFAGQPLRMDSTESSGGLYRAFLSGGAVAERPLRVEARLDPMGQLLHLRAAYTPPPTTAGPSARDVYGIFVIGLYVMLLIVVLVAFFRRLSQRVVDTRAALRDALWVALAGMGWMAVTVTVPILNEIPSGWLAAGIILFNMLLGGLGAAFVAFAASGAGDSISRSVWPERLAALSLLRNGAWADGRVGAALVRGIAGAGVVLGLLTGVLVLLPKVALRLGDAGAQMPDEMTISPALFIVSFYTLLSLLQFYAVVLVVGAGLRRRLGRWTYVLMAVLLAAMQAIVLSDAPLWQFALHLIPAAAVLWLFHRFDALTAFVALFVYMVMWDLAYAWMASGVPSRTGTLVLMGVLVLLFGIGLAVMLRGRQVHEDEMLVPSYIRERQHEARLERELEIARNVQVSFLPRRMPEVAGLDVAALCLPAMEVGGDYYDFVKLDEHRLALVIGDVSGKGIQASFYMTLVKGFVRTLAREDLGPADVLRRVNGLFYECAPRGTFISMIYGIVDVRQRSFTFARAGHNPVILHRAPSQQADVLQPPGLAIGLDGGARFDPALSEETLRLGLGDTLVLYTDGFSEAMDPDRHLYGDERLAEEASHLQGPSARHLLDALTHSVHTFMNGAPQHDDMTMIVLRF